MNPTTAIQAIVKLPCQVHIEGDALKIAFDEQYEYEVMSAVDFWAITPFALMLGAQSVHLVCGDWISMDQMRRPKNGDVKTALYEAVGKAHASLVPLSNVESWRSNLHVRLGIEAEEISIESAIKYLLGLFGVTDFEWSDAV